MVDWCCKVWGPLASHPKSIHPMNLESISVIECGLIHPSIHPSNHPRNLESIWVFHLKDGMNRMCESSIHPSIQWIWSLFEVFHFEDGMNEMWESSNPSIYPMNLESIWGFPFWRWNEWKTWNHASKGVGKSEYWTRVHPPIHPSIHRRALWEVQQV